jgi:hypothetical protein
MIKFTVGQSVNIKVRHTSNVLGIGQEIIEFIGSIVETPKWLGEDYVSIHTGKVEYPISHIKKQNIVGFEFNKNINDTRIFKVKSKCKGSVYNVIMKNGNISCDCIGFQFRKSCKHSDAIKKFIQNA